MPEGFSTDSYPKAPLPVSPLDIAGKIGSLQQQKLAIDQAKLDQANQGLTYMVRAMGSVGPGKSVDDYLAVGRNAVQMGLVPENMFHIYEQRMKASADPYREFMSAAQQGLQQIQMHTGVNTDKSNNATEFQGKTDVVTGAYNPVTSIPKQLTPGTKYYDPNNQEKLLPAAAPSGVYPVGASPASRQPMPTQGPAGANAPLQPRRMPVERMSGPSGPTVQTGHDFAERFAGDRGTALNAGPNPLFEQGKTAYTASQLNASSRAQSIKPAIQALKLMPGLSTGPGTAQYNDFVAGLKAWGITNTNIENDPTVARQELEKKLAQYVGSSPLGQRSDAQQALAIAGSPNPSKQILPALQNLTRDAIALDRVQILKPNAFKGTDYQNYIKHEGNFPQSVDEKALTLDLLSKPDRDKLIQKMATQYKKGDAGEKRIANKFLETLKLAKEHNIYEGM